MSGAARLVILGHGVAGLTAAAAARDQDAGLDITLVGDEPYDAYYRPRLTHDLATGIDAGKIRLRPPAWYEGARIRVVRGATATKLDVPARRVELGGGAVVDFDALIVATGSSAFMPPLGGGVPPAGVSTLRSVADAVAIRERAEAVSTVAVAGGGLLGLEAAYALAKLGRRVVVLERGASLLRRQLDRDGGELLAEILGHAGIEVWTGAEVESVVAGGGGMAGGNGAAGGAGAAGGGDGSGLEGVVLKDGRRLGCGLLLVAAGVRPNVGLARAAGIATDRGGIVVDDSLETSVPGVFACGDVASHRSGNFSIWPQAMAQGKVAGTNAAGGAASYGGVVPQNLLNVAGTSVLAVGEAGQPEGGEAAGAARATGAAGAAGASGVAGPAARSEVFRLDREQGKYAKFVMRGDAVTGAMLIGEPGLAQAATRAVQAGLSIPGLEAVAVAERFDYVVERVSAGR